RHRRRRARARSAEPRRGVPGTHRPPRRRDPKRRHRPRRRARTEGGRRVSTVAIPEPALAESDLRAALSTRARPSQASATAASFTLAWRAMLKIKHVPMQLFDVTAFPIMFTVLFTYLFGGALAGSPREYLQSLLPGILVMTV